MKTVIAQCNFIVGDFEANLAKIEEVLKDCGDQADMVVFSELALCGYYPFDLLDSQAFVQAHHDSLARLCHISEGYPCHILLGAISDNNTGVGKPIYNAALLIHKGRICFSYRKHLLPVYNIHDEARHFQSGHGSPVFSLGKHRFAVLLCEDIWHHPRLYDCEDPLQQCDDPDLEAIFVLNASPSEVGKMTARHQVVSRVQQRFQVPVVYVNQIGGNDEIVFDGSSFVIDAYGNIAAQAAAFQEQTLGVDLSALPPPQTCQPLSCEALWFAQLKLGLRDYIHKCGFSGVVVALSGGIDSAVVLALARYALGAEHVAALMMPGTYSSSGSVTDSRQLCVNLGVKVYERPIAREYELGCQEFATALGESPSQLTRENMQARIRGRMVMEFSNHFNVLAVATGNKSEMSVGYATLYGDMNGAVNVLGDLYKQDVYALAHYINSCYGMVIPQAILEKAPSAELAEDQKDADSLPPYDLLDAVLKLYIEGDKLEPAEHQQLYRRARSLSDTEYQRIVRMVDAAEFKRKQAPPIIRVQRRSFGLGRQLPVAQHFSAHYRRLLQ